MLSAHTWSIIGLCALPLLIWLPLWLWCDDMPHNQEQDDSTAGPEPDLGELTLAA